MCFLGVWQPHCARNAFSDCVSDDPLLILLGPCNGNYWSDPGTWGPWPEGAWLQHLHKTIPVFSSRGTTWGFCFYFVQSNIFYMLPPMACTSHPDRSPLSSHVLLQCFFVPLHPHSDCPASNLPHFLPRWLLHSPRVAFPAFSIHPTYCRQTGILTPDCSETTSRGYENKAQTPLVGTQGLL